VCSPSSSPILAVRSRMNSELDNSRTSTEVQASPSFSTWTPPTGVLGGIVAEAYERVERLRRDRSNVAVLERAAADAPGAPSFLAALRRPTVSVIAEVKRRSPSKGAINPSLSAAAQASAYVEGGAAAISVLTEPLHFAGSLDDLRSSRSAVALASGALVIGVNNRDLETLIIEPEVGAALVPLVPPDCIAIAESGVRDVSD